MIRLQPNGLFVCLERFLQSIGLVVGFTELHPYKVPELLALPVEAGLEKYLEWINGETTPALA